MWWGCNRIKGFWHQVHEIIQEISGREIFQPPTPTPQVMLLCGFSSCKLGVLGALLASMLIVAAILIASKWKSPEGTPPHPHSQKVSGLIRLGTEP